MQTGFAQAALEKPAVIVSVALALLAAAGGMMWTNIASHERQARTVAQAPVAIVTGVAAASDIARGQVLAAQDLTSKTVKQLPAGGIARIDAAQGHIALTDIKAGAPVLNSDISATAAMGISTRVPEGFRAYAVPVSEADIAGGFLQSGDHVDLYVTLPGALFADRSAGGKQDDQSKSTLLLSGITVLAVGTKLETDGTANTSVRTVTLALKSQDLVRVALAARLGTITFGIRNPAEAEDQAETLADLGALVGRDFGTKPQAASPAAKHAAPGIPMLSGAARTVIHP